MEMAREIRPPTSPGAEHEDATAVNRPQDRGLYAVRQKVYPKRIKGTFRRLKWLLMALTLGLYYFIPWVRWDRGPDLPSQAVILDMENERFFMFGLEIWPQEFYYVTGILIVAALTLFLVTALAGRVWCGYFCPQTVWTDLMVAVERFWQGDRNARIRLDKEPWSAVKFFKKTMTHVSWLAIALATGGAFVFYFADAPTLFKQLIAGTAPPTAYMFIAILTFTTYLLGGIAREQVCIYMCPWPRIQGAMTDHETLLVTYREWRGEPRGPMRKNEVQTGKGDCIDCKACIAVCPTGIDIRDGSQLECIQCALCIDACNDIMDRIHKPRNLIGYATIAAIEAEQQQTQAQKPARTQFIRARTILYFALIALVGSIMLWGLSARTMLEANVLPDRNPFFVKLSDGGVRNGYTLKLVNKRHEARSFTITASGLPGAKVTIAQGANNGADHVTPEVTVPADLLSELRVFVVVPRDGFANITKGSHNFDFVIQDKVDPTKVVRTTTFRSPP